MPGPSGWPGETVRDPRKYDPPLGLALLRGVHDWETSSVVSGVWVTSRRFGPSEWAGMQEVGFAGGGGGAGMRDGEEGGEWGGVH